MKFSRSFQQVLTAEGFPPLWVEAAVPYGQLKKCIKKVESELRSLGLDAVTLARLTSSDEIYKSRAKRDGTDGAVAFQYKFGERSENFLPKLILYLQIKEGLTVDAMLSPQTRDYLQRFAAQHTSPRVSCSKAGLATQSTLLPENSTATTERLEFIEEHSVEASLVQRIEVPLIFDAEFFGLLQGDVSTLDALQNEEQNSLTDEVIALGSEIAKVTCPLKHSKTDLNAWREVFDLYLQANVFFSTNELDHGARNSAVAVRQLQWFQAEIIKRDLTNSFRLTASRLAFEKFTKINLSLLRNLKFQEINQLAISKILKKFDKRTALGAKNSFPQLIHSDRIMPGAMAKAVCAKVSTEIVQLVPQLDDYLCPVCFSISYKPVRLTCNHVFCIRCMIQMQKQNAKYCPLCRGNVIMTADGANLDTALMLYLQKFFPRETKLKQRENEIAAGVDRYGPAFADTNLLGSY